MASLLLLVEGGEVCRRDVLAEEEPKLVAEGRVLCRWTQHFKPRDSGPGAAQLLKMTTEALFLELAGEPGTDPAEENLPLLHFLALMLERKRIIRNLGPDAGDGRIVLRHVPSKADYRLPPVEMDEGFFLEVQEKLGVLTERLPAA